MNDIIKDLLDGSSDMFQTIYLILFGLCYIDCLKDLLKNGNRNSQHGIKVS